MDTKKTLFHVIIRITILILLLIGGFLYYYLNYDPNQYNRHLAPNVGFFILAFILIQVFCLFLLLEIIYLVDKKRKNLAILNLTFISIIEISIFIYIY